MTTPEPSTQFVEVEQSTQIAGEIPPDREPPVENPQTPKETSPYDDPAFLKDHAEGTQEQIEGWNRDWRIRVDAIQAQTDLSRSEAMQYLALCQMGAVRGLLQGFQTLWNSDAFQSKRQKEQELTMMQHRIAAETLGIKTEGNQIVGPAGWRIP